MKGKQMKTYKNILERLAYYADKLPNKTAVAEAVSGKEITFFELWKKIVNFSTLIKTNGFKKGSRVIIRVTQSIDCLIAIYGVQLAGGTVIPLEENLSNDRITELMNYFESKTFISTKNFNADGDFYDLNEVINAPDCHENFEKIEFPNQDDIAFILYTTGTTGKSKGVMLSFRNRVKGADNQSVEIAVSPDDIGLISQPLSHSGGLRRCDALFLYGATVVLINGIGLLNDFFTALKKYNVTILWFVPAQFSLVSKRGSKQLAAFNEQLRVVIFESSKSLENQKELMRELLPDVRLYVNYSSTEATGTCHFEYSAFPQMKDCVGMGITPHSNVLFVDEVGNETVTSKDNLGILASEGETVALGYWKDPELSAKTFKNGRVISADVGYKDENGYIYITDRRDDVIVMGGNKISPAEVEDMVMRMGGGGIKECAVIPVPDITMGSIPKLYVVMDDNMEFSANRIMEYLTRHLEPFKVPKKVECIDKLPRVGVGKISRKILIEMSLEK
jgi:long-chain acyl-CoA synthetase